MHKSASASHLGVPENPQHGLGFQGSPGQRLESAFSAMGGEPQCVPHALMGVSGVGKLEV